MSADVVLNLAAIEQLCGRGGPGGEEVMRHAELTARTARGRAPRRTGRLISRIIVREGFDHRGYYVDVVTSATNPQSGYAYGTEQEIHRHYLVSSIR